MAIATTVTHYSDYTIKWATLEWEREQAFALRKRVFCNEQRLFKDDDRDEIDHCAQVLVAIANNGGWHEKIVGTVRIHENANNVWWGSRLAVDRQFRGEASLGSGLITLAVSSAHAQGCSCFLAQVQKKNEKLFQRLKWSSQYEMLVHGQPHVMMQAELESYAPFYKPRTGFVVVGDNTRYQAEIVPQLLAVSTASLTQPKGWDAETYHAA
ncbi:GNAT family N-acetyltransferase [Exilibacterium tricleocarpae]|uniref:GNAT family N-acetyltransferase n=1 Tax=Exilibacterium tricleocarpae TaxID=2591008 RepID=A0A545U9Y0_9GAMM|nr:MSMEG_0567/Sll0786 family nitrogen starvation N-acetyltransferase [Exilibacterium tricleocarpae]TQV86284.1 GNAT family N-acetyltransferase [Exilibacterium tricleocarpae]